jgi:flagellar biosynthesis protein FliQ
MYFTLHVLFVLLLLVVPLLVAWVQALLQFQESKASQVTQARVYLLKGSESDREGP